MRSLSRPSTQRRLICLLTAFVAASHVPCVFAQQIEQFWLTTEDAGQDAAVVAATDRADQGTEVDSKAPAPAAKDRKKEREEQSAAAAKAFKDPFFDNDFRYVLSPDYQDWHLGDLLKRRSLGTQSILDLGGQYRMRLQDEQNMRGLALTGLDDDFLLQRTRLFANLQLTDTIRIYGEYLDAASDGEEFAPRLIEENRSTMQNLFAEATLFRDDERQLWARAGRQELLFGDQRLVSPLDWANTRRTFDGSRLTWKAKKFESSLFWTRPVVIDSAGFDSPNRNEQFYGVFSTYRPNEVDMLDTFYLGFDNDTLGMRIDAFGARWYEAFGDWLIELWGDYQFGRNTNGSAHNAGAWTAGFGRKLPGTWKPTAWVYYDWASGSNELASGFGHFQFYPLAHRYLGFMDFFGRRNIESPNVLLTAEPSKKLTLLLWYYYLFLQDRRDTPYTVVMTPFAPNVTPGAAELGHELDLLATYQLTARASVLAGYSHFFSGAYYDTPGLPFSGDADFFYLQYQLNF